ncbi:hypothetical protein AK830_g12069 [Neonectria ditissima]|uniref:Velvet domain-containing protein n=1 Tax=Neonectria ditissima TaxID=78410 RepID=A0A0P7B1E2_9HYPO|nr:hypothetical protein AK830_g12069 [Neonectria ditissima]
MATPMGNSPGIPFMQSGQYDSSVGSYPDNDDFHSPQDEAEPVPKSYGDPERQLFVKQAPIHARVALGKEKDRKPVDPPPVIQIIDKRPERKSPLYNSPFLFVTCSLVAENYNELTTGSELPTSYLTGSLASSIHHLKDPANVEGGYFVFGDLSVKREGRFRLRFTLYDRDQDPSSDSPSVYFVSEIVTNPFTVYAPKEFPGMSESTFLTRSFTDQGVKLRLRKDSRAITTRKRNRRAAESSDILLNRQFKRTNLDRSASAASLGTFGASSSTTLSPDVPQEYADNTELLGMSGPSASQACISTSNSSPSVDPSQAPQFLSSPIPSQFAQGYTQHQVHPDMAAGISTPSANNGYNQGYHPGFGSDNRLQQVMGSGDGLGQVGSLGLVHGRALASPYAMVSEQIGHAIPDMSPRTAGSLDNNQFGNIFTRQPSYEEMNRQNNKSGGHYGIF